MNDLVLIGLVFTVLTLIGTPLFGAVGLTTVLALFLIDIPYTLLAQTAYTSLTPFPLLTIPLFVLAGRLMEVGGMATRLIGIATNLVGAYRGSLGLVTVFGCMLFAALSGSGPATTAAIGSVTVPAMKRDGYDVPFAAAIAAAGGALGSLIPPSNLMIIYGLVSETSIPRLFLAGVIPGIIVAFLLMITTYIIARRRGYGGTGLPFSWGPALKAMYDGKWAIGAPVLILGGIYSGAFTPTEAAAVAVFYALFVGTVIYRELTLRKVIDSLRFTALLTGLLILLTPTLAFGQLSAFYDIPAAIEALITSYTTNVVVVMILIGIFYIVIGTFMESLAQIILFTSVFLPLVTGRGVDPVLFGVFTVITCEIGFGEAISTARAGGARLQISHIQPKHGAPAYAMEHAIEMVDAARSRGVDVAYDVIPHDWSHTRAMAILPQWAQEGGVAAVAGRLRDPAMRARLKRNPRPMWRLVSDGVWDKIVLMQSGANLELVGKTFAEIGAIRGTDPYDAAFDLLLEEGEHMAHLMWTSQSFSETDIRLALGQSECAVISDTLALAPEGCLKHHIGSLSGYGWAARFLEHYVRDHRVMTLGQGVRRLTALPAGRLGLKDRGVLAVGACADITVFDGERIASHCDVHQPRRFATGIAHVVVNGVASMRDGERTAQDGGRVLRSH